MSVIDDPRVTRNGNDYHVTISHGRYQVEADDRFQPQPPLWKAYGEDGIWVGNLHRGVESSDPLRSVGDLTAAYETAAEVIAVLLACDGAAVSA